LLAEELARHWEVPVAADLLLRTRDTPPQMQLPADERTRNMHGAFAPGVSGSGRTVALVDDVFTTGSTLFECSRMLKRGGASRVLVLAVARALPGDADL
jgi:predicted amidophosphoribosyltransferase